MTKPESKEFTHFLTSCIEKWHNTHPELTCMQVLHSLEAIRHKLTEALIEARTK